MFNLKELQEEKAKVFAEAEAIQVLAKEEKREFTKEESARIDAILGNDDNAGELAALDAKIDRAEKFEARRKEVARRYAGQIDDQQHQFNDSPKSVVVPAKAKRHGKLKAFGSVDDGERAAYISGHILAAHFYGNKNSKKWLDEHGIEASLSSTDSNNSGLFVPVEMETAIIRLVEEYGVFRRYSNITSMASRTKIVPVRVSGMTAYPVAETTDANEGSNTGTQTEPKYTNVELVARKWKAWLKESDELNEDSLISFADQVAVESALAFAYAEDNAGFNGDGTSTYHSITGVLNAVNAGSVYTAATGNTAFSTLDLSDFEGIVGQLPEYPNIMPAWFISKEGYYASMHRLAMAAGGNDVENFASGGPRTFLSFPVVFTNVLNKTLTAQASTKVAVLGDLRLGTLFGDRRDMTMSLTDQRFWDEDQIAIKATERFDINVHSKGTATESGAVMVLQTAAS